MATKKSRCSTKENRIPIGKKKDNINKLKDLKKSEELKSVINNKKTSKKTNNTKESNPLKILNINSAPTDTSLTKPVDKPRAKLSTIKEIEEKNLKSRSNESKTKIKTKSVTKNASMSSVYKDEISNESTKLIRNVPVLEEHNNTIDDILPPAPEVVLSPFVCTTRGQKWKPSPRKPPKLSELYDKYEDDNDADTYRKRLDEKTVELQNKVKFWTELSSENGDSIPQTYKDEIDVVCGQTKLLTTDKFMQMRSLIEEFDNKSGSMPIKLDDLDGFWDMLLLQVNKLEGQFSQLTIMKDNNWAPLQPIAKKVLNKVVPNVNKRPQVKSKFADFLKNQKIKEKNVIPNSIKSDEKNNSNHSRFHEMKTSTNTCLISSTPTSSNSSNQKSVSFTPMLLKTMELSHVARRSGMTPIVVVKPHVSPLKPALKNPEQEKGFTKRKTLQFLSPKETAGGFVTPENSLHGDVNNKKSTQDRVATPHNTKTSSVNKNNVNVRSQSKPICSKTTDGPVNKNNLKKKKKLDIKEPTVTEMSTATQNNEGIRRSSRLANKPSKNYKC